MKKPRKYYAVREGRIKGIFLNWDDCKAQVDGYSQARFRSFANILEAEDFLLRRNTRTKKQERQLKRVIETPRTVNLDEPLYTGTDVPWE